MMQQAQASPRHHEARQQKRQPELPSCERVAALLLRRAAEVGELVAELLDAAAERIDALLRAGVERMRLARGLELVERQLAAVVHLDRLARLRARAGDEL